MARAGPTKHQYYEVGVFLAEHLQYDVDQQIIDFMGRQPDKVYTAPFSSISIGRLPSRTSPYKIGRVLLYQGFERDHAEQLVGTIKMHYAGDPAVQATWGVIYTSTKRVKYKSGRPVYKKPWLFDVVENPGLPVSRSLPHIESMTTRRVIYYHGKPVMPVYGESAVEAVHQGAPLLVFNPQKGWIPAGSGALQRLEQALRDNSTPAIMSYCALVPHPIAIGKRGYVPRSARNPRKKTVDVCTPCGVIAMPVDGTSVRTGPRARAFDAPSAWPRYVYQIARQGKLWFVLISSGTRRIIANSEKNASDAFDWAVHDAMLRSLAEDTRNPNPIVVLDDLGECVQAFRPGGEPIECPSLQNPWTPPNQFWPKYTYRIKRINRYSTKSQPFGEGYVIVLLEQEYGKKDRTYVSPSAGSYVYAKDAFDHALTTAIKQSLADPRNPNPVVLINEYGRCEAMFLAGNPIECPPVPNPRMEDVRSISQYVHWTLGRYGYVGVGQVTGDTYSIMPIVEDDVPVFTIAIAASGADPFGPGRMLGKSSRRHKKLMLRADKREAKYTVARAG